MRSLGVFANKNDKRHLPKLTSIAVHKVENLAKLGELFRGEIMSHKGRSLACQEDSAAKMSSFVSLAEISIYWRPSLKVS